MAQAILPQVLTNTTTSQEVTDIKVYVHKATGTKLATVANWRKQLMTPKDDVTPVVLTTPNGYEITLFRADDVEAFDPAKAEAKKAKLKDLKAEMKEVNDLYFSHKLSDTDYQARLKKVTAEIVKINS